MPLYGAFIDHLAQKRIDLDTDTIKVALCTSSYTPNQDTHDFFNDVTNELPTAGGYTAGGLALSGVTWTYSAGSNTWTLDAADTEWSTASFSARIAVLYVDTAGASSTDPLIGYIDFGSDKTADGGPFKLQWNASGIFTHTV